MSNLKPEVVGAEEAGDQKALAKQLTRVVSGVTIVPDVIDEYLEQGHAKSDRIRILVRVAICLTLAVGVVLIAVKFLPDLMETVLELGKEMEKEKSNVGLILLCILIVIFYVATPFPGRGAFNLIMGYVYGWWALPMLYFGQIIGGYIAFMGARYCWPRMEPRLGFLQGCCSCCTRKSGEPSKMLRFLLASLAAVEEKPLQTVFLMVLSPIPVTMMSYVLGAKCPSLPSTTYVLGVAAGSVKVVMSVYLSTTVADMGDLVTAGADKDPVDMIVQGVSVVIAILVFTLISRRTYLQLQKSQDELKEMKAVASDEEPVRSASHVTILSLELCSEYATSRIGVHKANTIGLETQTPRYCTVICSVVCFAVGVACFVAALATLVTFTPMFEEMTMEMGPRLLCPHTSMQFPSLFISSVKISIPITLTNPNPIEIEAVLGGPIFDASSGGQIGRLLSTSFTLPARDRSLLDAGSPEQVTFDAVSEITNLTSLGIPDKINLMEFLTGSPMPAPMENRPNLLPANPTEPATDCVLPADVQADTSAAQVYFQCKRSKCEDSDLMAISGKAGCSMAARFLGCDADLSEQEDFNLPQGTYLHLLCSKTCNACPRLLASDGPPRPRKLAVESAIVIGMSFTGTAKMTLLGCMELEKEVSRTTYIRRELQISLYETITSRIAELKASGQLRQGAGSAGACELSTDEFDEGVCSDDKAALLGEKVTPDGDKIKCGIMGLSDEDETQQEQRKWFLLILIMLLSLCCFCGSCYCCMVQGRLAWRMNGRQNKNNDGNQGNAPPSTAE